MRPIRAITEKCLEHFDHSIRGEHYYVKRQAFATLMGMSVQAIYRWVEGDTVPQGENLLRLRAVLTLLGYRVIEFEVVRKELRDVSELIAFRVLTQEQLVSLIGYAGEQAKDQLLRVLFGKINTSIQKLNTCQEISESYASELAAAKQEALHLLRVADTSSEPALQPATRTPMVSARPLASGVEYQETLADAFVASVEAILPLAEFILSDAYSALGRDGIRKRVGAKVSRLSLLFTQLSGEGARTALAQKPAKAGVEQ